MCVADGHFVMACDQSLSTLGTAQPEITSRMQPCSAFNLTSTSVCVTDETVAAVLTAWEGSVKQAWRLKVIKFCLWMPEGV